ncbi:MAG: hypothetical protein ACRCY3_15290 [Sphingorhabdus sp.]
MIKRGTITPRVRGAALACVFALAVGSCGGDDTSSTPPVTIPTPPPSPPPPPPTSSSALITAAKAFPAMPEDTAGLATIPGYNATSLTFSSGIPYNDLEYTLFDTDYIDGETNGYDTFMPVDPSAPVPGANKIKIITATGNVKLDTTYSGQGGDRIILGTAEIASPFFARGSDGLDNDYAVITSMNYKLGHIQLRGSASDYGLVRCTLADGCKTDGFYLFHTAGSQPDLVAFIFPCDDLPALAGSTNQVPQTGKALCNTSEALSLSDTNQFRFAQPVSTAVAVSGQVQLGTTGKEIIGGVASDAAGNRYIYGQSDGSLAGGTATDNQIFVAQVKADGSRGWTWELPQPNGSLIWDAVTDNDHLYAVGRTLGAIPGGTSAGRWDGIIIKIRLSDGVQVASNQWGNSGLDGYGNVVLDDAGNLFVSGQGSPANATGTDDQHLVAKHRISDLGNVWRQIIPPQGSGQIAVAEAWGGLTYVPGSSPGDGRLIAGGWYMNVDATSGNAQGFLEVWTGLNQATPQRSATTTIVTSGVQADWVLDNTVDAAGNIYAVGYTTGSLDGTQRGNGDAYIVKYDANLRNPVFKQIGTAQSDQFRKLEIGSDGSLYAQGYTYGDYNGTNPDNSKSTGDVFVVKFDSALNVTRSFQFGTPNEDRGYISLRGSTLHVGGMTEAALGGANRGSFDGFLMRLDLSLSPI